jgi:hypothetical protein
MTQREALKSAFERERQKGLPTFKMMGKKGIQTDGETNTEM